MPARSRLLCPRSGYLRQTVCRYTRYSGYKRVVAFCSVLISLKQTTRLISSADLLRTEIKMSDCIKTDVFISGGGPVGLLIAYSLARQGVQSVLVGKSPPPPPTHYNAQGLRKQNNTSKNTKPCTAAPQPSTHAPLKCSTSSTSSRI